MHPFRAATTWSRTGEGRYEGAFDERWYQGKGAYGGVVAGGLARCLEDTVADPRRRLRSFTVHFCAPALAGPVVVETRVERTGSLVTHTSARALQGGAAVAVATATFAAPRRPAGDERIRFADARVPEAPGPDEVAPFEGSPLMPTFTQFFEYRFAVGHAPFSGGDEAVIGGWLRPKEPLALDAALAVALLDAFPPAVLARVDGPAPAASVDMTTHFYADLPLPAERAAEPLLVVARSRWAQEGYAEERAELFTADGALVAECSQLVAVLG